MKTTTQCQDLYEKHLADILLKQKILKHKISAHKRQFKSQGTNYGFVGDLEYVSNELSEIINHFNQY